MNILLDVSRALEPQLTGIGVSQKELFENLKALDGNFYNIIPVYYGRDKNLMTKQINGVEIFGLYNPYYFSMRNRLYDYFFVKPRFKKFKNYLFHSTAYRCITGIEDRTIMTIHDLIFIRDEFHYNKLYHNIVKYYLPRVRGIIAISEYTKREILELFPKIKESNVYVIYQGVGKAISRVEDLDLINRYREKLVGKGNEYILFLGGITKRKNIENIIRAYYLLLREKKITNVKVVIAGKPLDDFDRLATIVEDLSLDDSVFFRKYVPFDEISVLLTAAKVFVFPSLYEGFGLPVLEAMKCGVPVVTSNATSLGELFLDSAITIDPLSVDEIADGIYRLLRDEQLRNKYITLGLKKARHLTWERTTTDVLKVYKEILNK